MASWTLFTLDRTEYRIDVTFAILFGWIIVTALIDGGPNAALWSAIFVAIVFGSVFVHELGHLLAAKAFDIRTEAVTLNFFGGAASFVRKPQTWTAEILIAIAGPAVNLAVALVLLVVTGDLSIEAIRGKLLGFRVGIVDTVIYINLVLALFNLIPALPFDGGRVLRGLLSPVIGVKQGTLVPAYLGVGFGVVLAVYSLAKGDTFTMILGLFLAFSAWIWVQWAQGIANRSGGSPRP